jgi:hypothetical protein
LAGKWRIKKHLYTLTNTSLEQIKNITKMILS